MRPFFLLLFNFLFFLQIEAQVCGSIAYSSRDGLVAYNYMSVFQDSKGMLWVGSYDSGLSRFDGQHWQSWIVATGLLSTMVGNIFEDKEGGIWLDHQTHGVSRWKGEHKQCFDFHQDTCPKGSLYFDQLQKTAVLVETGWQGKVSARSYTYDFKARKFLPSEQWVLPETIAAPYDHFSIWKGGKEKEWWAYGDKNNKRVGDFYFIKNGQFQKLSAPPGGISRDLSNPLYSNTSPSPELGEALIQNAQGVFILKEKQWRRLSAPSIPRYTAEVPLPPLQFVTYSYDLSSNSLFVVWYLDEKSPEKRCLLAEYDPVTLQLRRTILFSNLFLDKGSARQICKDTAGTIWVTTSGNVLRLFPDQLYLPVTTPGMPSQTWAVAQANDGNIWFASYGEGLVGFDGLFLRPQPPSMKTNVHYNDGSLTDKRGNMYFNNASEPELGILKFDGKNRWDFLAADAHIQGFFLNYNNRGQIVWGTSGQGLWILREGKTGQSSADWLKINRDKGLKLENVLTALQDRYGRYWMGRASQGFAMYDPAKDTVVNWMRKGSETYGCMSMAEDSRGNLWFGTDHGLCFFKNRPDLPPDFDLQTNLLRVGGDFTGESLVMSCLAYNTHTLVFGNATGLHLLDLDSFYASPRRIRLRSFNLNNGYQAGPVGQNALFIDSDSCIWLTAANGALRYDLRALPHDTVRPQVFVDSLVAGGKPFRDFFHPLSLGSGQRFLQIYFHAPLNPMLYDNLRFEYQLTGDTTWVKILPDARSVAFPSLKAGKYRFELRAIKEGQVSVSAIVDFQISPILWETPWFWLFILIAIIATGVLWRIREVKIAGQNLQISQQQLQLEKSINEMARMSKEKDRLQIQAIVNQLNPHFINNALQWLQVRVDEDEEAVRVVGKLSENISMVFKNSRMKKSYHSMREEMKLTENYLFIQKCRFGAKLTYEMPDEKILAALETMSVPLMIVQIHAENAVEHGIRNKNTGIGQVRITLHEDDTYAIITIEDDGVGRKVAREKGSKGTQNGTTMLTELETIYNKQNHLPLGQFYEDDIFMDDKGQPYGTRVIVRMPKHYNFEF